ncbi:stealth conserved region 3 domain-containing protein [Vibrio ishigakensis]|nr:Stealth CR1 domain-containing protein [Vibrio ishigakensis]
MYDSFANVVFNIRQLNVNSNTQRIKEPPFPIDVVITWVDSNDVSWRKKLHEFSAIPEPQRGVYDSKSEERFDSNDELKYLLRSIAKYASWVRKIYLVTDNQKPNWLKDSDKIKVVDHRDIFLDNTFLPSFNSHAIESNLHRIPGLSENFLYMNDDFLFSDYVSYESFFTEDGSKTKFCKSASARVADSINDCVASVDFAAYNNKAFMRKNYLDNVDFKLKHTPMALKKSVIKLFEHNHENVVRLNSSNRFRSQSDYSLLSSLIHYYGEYNGTAVSSDLRYLYVSLLDPLFAIKINFLKLKGFPCCCTNDVPGDRDLRKRNIELYHKTMLKIFPEKSSCEK